MEFNVGDLSVLKCQRKKCRRREEEKEREYRGEIKSKGGEKERN
jgi:hypothetical protein